MAIIAAKKETKKKVCPVCKKTKSIATGFYKSSSPLFALDGCVPICIDCVKNDVVNGKDIVLIIPEQFSFECERQLLHTLGDSAAMRVEVLSFSRICDEVNRIAGGNAFSVMSDCDKIITVKCDYIIDFWNNVNMVFFIGNSML